MKETMNNFKIGKSERVRNLRIWNLLFSDVQRCNKMFLAIFACYLNSFIQFNAMIVCICVFSFDYILSMLN